MKRTIITAVILTTMAVATFADGQVRFAGYTATPAASLPSGGVEEWQTLATPTDLTMSGWNWEIVFDRFGLGMHYGTRTFQQESHETDGSEWYLGWRGDFFLSYHIFGGGSLIDPFVEIGWGNAGTATIASPEQAGYPDWKDEVHYGTAVDVAMFTYAAAGLALDLNGLLLGAKLSYAPAEMVDSAPRTDVAVHDMMPFELSLFGGIALGGHRNYNR